MNRRSGWSAARSAPILLALVLAVACGPAAPPSAADATPSASGGETSAAADDAAEDDGGLTAEQREEIERLESLGYAAGGDVAGEDDETTGVTVYDAERACGCWNLVVSGHAAEAVLMDMEGRARHRWRRSFHEIWPDREVKRSIPGQHYFRRARVLADGGLLAVFEGLGLVALDKDSNVRWAWDGPAHHDLDVAPDGRIWVLTRRARLVPEIHPEQPVLEDFLTVLDPDGTEVESISLLACLRASGCAGELERMKRGGDVFHTNTLERLDGRLADRSPAFAAGNFLVSLRHLDLLAVVDPERRTVPWCRRGTWKQQHQPVLLPSGTMLLFDNKGTPGRSRVLEIDPLDGRVVWSYGDAEDQACYSATCGSCQRLPNGDTLITESDRGRAFEVTPDGTVDWEYRSPYRAGRDHALVATLFEVVRLPPDFPSDWIE